MPAIRLLVAFSLLFGTSLSYAQTEGIAPSGRKGVLHEVVKGDTLWDLSSQYLGTPWIWPSIWKENEIENPHLIYPGDLIWITENEMRKVTAEEARRLMQAIEIPGDETPQQPAPEPTVSQTAPEPAPAEPTRDQPDKNDPFASLDANAADVQRVINFPGLHRYSYITGEELEGAASILGSHDEGYWTSQERRTIVSLGEGQAHIGDAFSIFRTRKRVQHPETGEIVGYFIHMLGKAEVVEIHPESSFVKVVAAYSEIQPGDRLIPYVEPPSQFKVTSTTETVHGQIIAHMPYRQYEGAGDLVIIDRGAEHGVKGGRELQVFRAGKEVVDPGTLSRVMVPDDIIGNIFVLRSSEETSVALIQSANRPVRVGDHFRDK